MAVFWAFLAGANFYFYLIGTSGFKYVSLGMVAFCIWRLFASVNQQRQINEMNEFIKTLEIQEEEIKKLYEGSHDEDCVCLVCKKVRESSNG
jgi:hypothetical protein